MAHYWLSVTIFAWHSTLDFLGKSRGGIVLDIIVVVLAIYRLYQKRGWDEMKKKVFETVIEGVAITLVAAIFVYICEFIAAPPAMAVLDQAKVINAQLQQQKEHELKIACGNNLSVQVERAQLLSQQKEQQQLTINSQQTQMGAQQGTVNQCVVSLGKMNPIIREHILVVQVRFATMDVTGKTPTNRTGQLSAVMPKRYITELFFVTNVSERNFHGNLQCDNDFEIVDMPVVNTEASAILVSGNTPKRISDRSFEVRYDASNTEWNQSHPAYMRVMSKAENLGSCTFTKME